MVFPCSIFNVRTAPLIPLPGSPKGGLSCGILLGRIYSKEHYSEGCFSSEGLLVIPKNYCQLLQKDTLRKHAYSNILKTLPPKNEKFQIKNSDFLHNSAQNIDCGSRRF